MSIVVSLGVAVPDVVAMSRSDAISAITNAGLTVGTELTQNSSTEPVGNVIDQDPAAGTNEPAGSAVDLLVARGVADDVAIDFGPGIGIKSVLNNSTLVDLYDQSPKIMAIR